MRKKVALPVLQDPPGPREHCPVHGWVGRKAFQQDRHDLCEAPIEPLEEIVEEVVEEEQPPAQTRLRRSSARRRGIPPKKTIAVRRITQADLEAGRAELRALGADVPYDRPKSRADCVGGPRPCPFVGCRYNLYLDTSETGSLIFNFPHLTPDQMPPDQSCALDLADKRPMTLEEIAVVTNLTRERIRQLELKALLRRARPAALALGIAAEDVATIGDHRGPSPGADLIESSIEGDESSDAPPPLTADNERDH